MRKSYIPIALAVLLLHPQPLWGQRSFFPKISGYSGDLELDGSYESIKNETTRRTLKRTEIDFRERLNLAMTGFVYHPRFIAFRAAGAGGVQETFSRHNAEGDWKIASTEQYDFSTVFLPKHPYNLELFTSLRAPLFVGKLTGDSGPVKRYQSGAYLRYKRLPWSGSLSYITDKIESQGAVASDTLSSDTADIYRMDFTYFKRFFILNSYYQHTGADLADRSVKAQDQVYVDNKISHKFATLFSNWKLSEEDVTRGDATSTFRRESWVERLNLRLPLSFSAGFSFQQDSNQTFSDRENPLLGDGNLLAFDESTNYSASLTHQLYQSLQTGAVVSYGDTDSSSGQSERSSYRLRMNYIKKLYRGNISAGGWTGVNTRDRTGAERVLQEALGPLALLEPFTLSNPDIDKETVVVTVTDEFGNIAVLEEGVHYSFLPVVDNTVQIIITALPPGFDFSDIFEATYALIAGDFKLETRSSGYNFRLSLWDNLLSTYYLHSTTAQSLLEGVYPGVLNNGDSDTVGVTVQKAPFSVGLEYQQVDSDINSEKRWAFLSSYSKNLTAYTDVNLKLEAKKRVFQVTQGEDLPSPEQTESVYSGEMQLQSRIPKKNLTFYLTANYSLRQGFVDSTIYTLNSHLTWYVGKAYVNLGASYSIYRSAIEDNVSLGTAEFIYVKIKRDLF